MPKIELIVEGVDVAPMVAALEAHPELWSQFTTRTENPESPHHGTQDIWARWADPATVQSDGSHMSTWFPPAGVLPVKEMAGQVMALTGALQLGGVLITRIPAGESVKPHVDTGWHAGYYEKFAVQVAANEKQAFCFHGEKLVTKPGDVFRFDNSHEHWVTNDSDEARVTAIFCIRR